MIPFASRARIAFYAALALSTSAVLAQVPAFPGAQGFGAAATGGRGGTVVHVTNLNDSGPGSFRDAVSQPNRIVVFDVGGYIVLQSPVSVYGNITIAGQTAPGDGIGIMGGEVSLSNKSNIIVRNVRFRQGNLDPQHGKSALGMSNSSDIILDHCSFEYGQWDSIDAVKTSDFTVSNSLIADPIYQQFGAHVERGPSTFYRNLWVNAHNRQPLAKDNTQYINNIVYDYELGYTVGNTGGYFSHDIINNYFIAGPATSTPSDNFFQMNNKQTVYAVGNMLDADKDGTLNGTPDNTVGSSLVATSPWASSTTSIPTLSATDAFPSVVGSAGAWPRDAVDQLAVDNTNSLGTVGELYKDQAVTGLPNDGYGTLNGGTLLPSTTGDGIPDYWAQAYGISTTDPNAATANFGTTGYTNLEAYFNSLVLPDLWSAHDINSPALTGASSYNALTGTWLLTGGGNAHGPHFDQVQFAAQPWTSNGSLTARLDDLTDGEAGLLVRADANANSSFVALVVDRGGLLKLLSRPTDGARAIGIQQARFEHGTWLRLVRNGDAFAAYVSRDGAHWHLFGVATAATTSTTRAGLAVASVDAAQRAVAKLSNVAFAAYTGSEVSLTADHTTLTFPQPLEATVSVAITTGDVPSGVAELWDGSRRLGEARLDGDARANFHIHMPLFPGTHTLTSTYSGDAHNPSGLAAPITITVQGNLNGNGPDHDHSPEVANRGHH